MKEPVEFTAEEQKLLYRVARNLLNGREYGELLASVLDVTIQALGADRGCIVVREDGQFKVTAARNFRNETLAEAEEEVSSTIAKTAAEEGRVLAIADAQLSERFRGRAIVRRLGLRSVLCAPLIARDEAFALIYLENRDISNCFGERQRELLTEICSLAAPRLHKLGAHANCKALQERLTALCLLIRRWPSCCGLSHRWHQPRFRS